MDRMTSSSPASAVGARQAPPGMETIVRYQGTRGVTLVGYGPKAGDGGGTWPSSRCS